MKFKKIVYLANAASIHTVKWVNEMANRGHKIDLITMNPPDVINPIDNKVNIHLLPIHHPVGYFFNAYHLKRLLKLIKPDLLHVHYASGYGTLSRLSGYHPTLLSVWGSDVLIFPHQINWKRKLLKKNLASADYIASTSNIMKEETQKFVNSKNPITVTPFGVDCEKFKPMEILGKDNEFIVGTVKALEKNYGIEHLIRAFAILKKNYQGKKLLRLVIGGKGSLQNQLMNLTKELGINNETEFLGQIPHENVPGILNRFSVYVLASDSESFGVAVIEASACGIPVVVSDAGGLQEVVKDGVTGFIVPKRNPEEIAKALTRLIENNDLKNSMGLAGRDFVLQEYEWNENSDRMERLYDKILIEM